MSNYANVELALKKAMNDNDKKMSFYRIRKIIQEYKLSDKLIIACIKYSTTVTDGELILSSLIIYQTVSNEIIEKYFSLFKKHISLLMNMINCQNLSYQIINKCFNELNDVNSMSLMGLYFKNKIPISILIKYKKKLKYDVRLFIKEQNLWFLIFKNQKNQSNYNYIRILYNILK